MKVLLVAPSYSPQVNTIYFPLGLAYISAYAKKGGHLIDGINLNHYPDPARYELLTQKIKNNFYDAVGITGLTVCFNEIEKLIQLVRKTSPQLPIILGGGITSCEAELVMEALKPDYMVVGEGETIFINLLRAIAGTAPLNMVSGIWHWRESKPVHTGTGPIVQNLDALPEPDLDCMGIKTHLKLQDDIESSYHLTRYDMGRSIPISASRSCPFRCTFCHHAGMGKYKTYSIDIVAARIEQYINKYGVNCIYIYDELFSADKQRIRRFCKLLHTKSIRINWFCQLRVDQLDQECLRLMKASGCNFISLGFESGSDTILQSMQKKITTRQIADAVKMLRKANIGFQANFLFGDPAECNETINESLRFQEDNKLYFVDWSAVIPYAGTKLFENACREKIIGDKEKIIREQCNISTYLYKHQVNMTKLSDAEYHKWYIYLREKSSQNHRKRLTIINKAAQTGKWTSTLTLECPSCRHQITISQTYPLEVRDGEISNFASPIGLVGINFLCVNCCRKMHLTARQIPHMAHFFNKFQQTIDKLRNSNHEVVVIPAMDRYFTTFSKDIDFSGLRVKAVLDSRDFRVNQNFMDQLVEPLNKKNIQKSREAFFLILPWVEYQKATDMLSNSGIADNMVLAWNSLFSEY